MAHGPPERQKPWHFSGASEHRSIEPQIFVQIRKIRTHDVDTRDKRHQYIWYIWYISISFAVHIFDFLYIIMSAFDFEVGTDATSSSLLPGKDEATAGHHYVAIFPKDGERLLFLTIRPLTALQNTILQVPVPDKRLPVRKHVPPQMNRRTHPPTDAPPLHLHPHPHPHPQTQTPRSARTSPAAVRTGQSHYPLLILNTQYSMPNANIYVVPHLQKSPS